MFCSDIYINLNLKGLEDIWKLHIWGGSFSIHLKIDCYPGADFVGVHGHEKVNDPACVKSRTGFVITEDNCHVLLQSKLQSEPVLSAM